MESDSSIDFYRRPNNKQQQQKCDTFLAELYPFSHNHGSVENYSRKGNETNTNFAIDQQTTKNPPEQIASWIVLGSPRTPPWEPPSPDIVVDISCWLCVCNITSLLIKFAVFYIENMANHGNTLKLDFVLHEPTNLCLWWSSRSSSGIDNLQELVHRPQRKFGQLSCSSRLPVATAVA